MRMSTLPWRMRVKVSLVVPLSYRVTWSDSSSATVARLNLHHSSRQMACVSAPSIHHPLHFNAQTPALPGSRFGSSVPTIGP